MSTLAKATSFVASVRSPEDTVMVPPSVPDLASMVEGFETGFAGLPNYARNVLGLAEVVAEKKDKLRAFELARKALHAAQGDPILVSRARSLLSSLVPGYHVPMMNDSRRNLAWDAALRRAINPGDHVLEIGTGAGMLALMAARAGAGLVITCEQDPVTAAIGREIAERNGYGERIRIIAKHSRDLEIGVDLDRPADLLFCDIFGDSLVDFAPLPAVADARRRLVAPGAPSIPATASIRVALCNWAGYERRCRIHSAAGFDLTPFVALLPLCVRVEIGDTSLHLLSGAAEPFRFDMSAPNHSDSAQAEVSVTASEDGILNGIVQWICLDLDATTSLESRPEPGAVFFSSPRFFPLADPLPVRAGRQLQIGAAYHGKSLALWIAQ